MVPPAQTRKRKAYVGTTETIYVDETYLHAGSRGFVDEPASIDPVGADRIASMMRKRWHAMGLAEAVGVATSFAVGASSGPDSIEFWTGELLSLVMPHPLLGTRYWRLTEGVSVAVMALPGMVLV